jgi:hypothetical protein
VIGQHVVFGGWCEDSEREQIAELGDDESRERPDQAVAEQVADRRARSERRWRWSESRHSERGHERERRDRHEGPAALVCVEERQAV